MKTLITTSPLIQRDMAEPRAVLGAVRDGDLVRLRDLLDADPAAATARGPDGLSALLVALYRGHTDQVRLLVDHGAVASVHEAAALGDLAALDRFLQDDPGQLDAPGPDGFPPLHLAAHFARHEALEQLLDAGADLHRRSANALENTALHAAAAGSAVATARILLASGADPDDRDAGGNTPLHVAAASGALPVAEALLAGGAEPALRNQEGHTPRELAAARGDDHLVALLQPAREDPAAS